MAERSRIPFLTVFFVVLILTVGAAIAWRVTRYVGTDRVPRTANGETVETGAGSSTIVAQPNASAAPFIEEATGTIAPRYQSPPGRTGEQTRKQLFERLLAQASGGQPEPPESRANPVAPPPAVAVAAPAPQRTAVVRPIAQPAPQPGSTAPGRSSSGGSGSSGSTSDSHNSNASSDPNSDSTAPQVVSLAFTPPEVADGETTTLTIVANDDLSGVKGISGTITSPTGALQGFACVRDGETDRYLARVTVPKDAAEGTWRISFINLMDNASNTASITYTPPNVPPNATFKVKSQRPDSQGPTLKAAWIEKPAMRAGEKNTIYIQAEDDKSGVQSVTGVLLSPHRTARFGFSCTDGDNDGTFDCSLQMPTCLDCGVWTLEQVQMQDKANNMSSNRDNPLVTSMHVDIVGDQCDFTLPVMQSIALDQNVVSNAQENVITIRVIATDDMCGVGSISGHALGPAKPGSVNRLFFALSPAGDNQTFTGQLRVPRLAPKGLWSIGWVQVLDKGFNLKAYSTGDPVLANATFRVE